VPIRCIFVQFSQDNYPGEYDEAEDIPDIGESRQHRQSAVRSLRDIDYGDSAYPHRYCRCCITSEQAQCEDGCVFDRFISGGKYIDGSVSVDLFSAHGFSAGRHCANTAEAISVSGINFCVIVASEYVAAWRRLHVHINQRLLEFAG